MKFLKLGECELKQDTIPDFKLVSNDNNVALLGSTGELMAMELQYLPNSCGTFPYTFSYIEIPREYSCENLFKNKYLKHIYAKCCEQESHELSMEPMFVAEYSVEPQPKAKIVQLDWAPCKLANGQPMLAALTAYGVLQVFSKTSIRNRQWEKLYKFNDLLLTDTFAPCKSVVDIQAYREFKKFTGLYWITAFSWNSKLAGANFIYLATAAGYIVVFEFKNDFSEVKEYCRVQSEVDSINYIKNFEDFLIIGSIHGIVQLLKINHVGADSAPPSIVKVECLWSDADGLAFRKAEITYSSELNSYFVVFTKGAHLLAYRISKEQGTIICSSTLYVGGTKISDLDALTELEFFITTIAGFVHHVRLSCTTNDTLTIEERIVPTEIDETNYQILGVAKSRNRNLWSFVLYRNKEYGHHSKFHNTTTFVTVCKLNTIDSLTKLANLNIITMDECIDYAVAIQSDIWNNFEWEKYNGFFELTNAKFPKELNDAFLQKLQIKFLIVRNMVQFQRKKLTTIRKLTLCEQEFLLHAIQMTHIICRLQYLVKLGSQIWTPFQRLSFKCMKSKLVLLVSQLTDLNNENNPLRNTIERFTKLVNDELNCKYDSNDVLAASCNEKCLECNAEVDAATMECASEHKVKRCFVSYVQVPLFSQLFCAKCSYYAFDDDALQQIFAPGEKVKCIFCRFLFINDEI